MPSKTEWVNARAREIQKKGKLGYLGCLAQARNEWEQEHGNGSQPAIVGVSQGHHIESKCPHCGGSLIVEVRGG